MYDTDLKNTDIRTIERRAHQLRAEATAEGAKVAMNWIRLRLHLKPVDRRHA